MQNKLLLIDGQNLLFQMFYGMPAKITGKNGQNIEGVWGFTKAILNMSEMIHPTHILVIFDGAHTLDHKMNFYRKCFMEEPEEEKNPYEILEDIKRVLEELHIAFFETKKEYKINDYMKEYVKRYEKNSEIVISSWDYDFIELVSNHVSLLTYKGKSSSLYTPEKVLAKWKIKPEYFADYKALVGDDSSHIAGIPRVGPKMATTLIKDFGHVEDILKNIAAIPKENVRLTLDIFQKDLMNNIKLIRLEGSHEIPITLEELKWEDFQMKTKDVLQKLDLIEVAS